MRDQTQDFSNSFSTHLTCFSHTTKLQMGVSVCTTYERSVMNCDNKKSRSKSRHLTAALGKSFVAIAILAAIFPSPRSMACELCVYVSRYGWAVDTVRARHFVWVSLRAAVVALHSTRPNGMRRGDVWRHVQRDSALHALTERLQGIAKRAAQDWL